MKIDETKIKSKWRLEPGKMLLVDLEKGIIIKSVEGYHLTKDINKNVAGIAAQALLKNINVVRHRSNTTAPSGLQSPSRHMDPQSGRAHKARYSHRPPRRPYLPRELPRRLVRGDYFPHL